MRNKVEAVVWSGLVLGHRIRIERIKSASYLAQKNHGRMFRVRDMSLPTRPLLSFPAKDSSKHKYYGTRSTNLLTLKEAKRNIGINLSS